MKIIHLVTPLTGDGTRENPRRPAAADQFNLRVWSEVSNSEPYAIAALVEDSMVTTIESDPAYGPSAILEVSDLPEDVN